MTNSFFDIPREKLKDIYPQIISNSTAQYNTAITIASSGQPGIAVSHLLISSEEMIKALIVALDSIGFKFRAIKGMDIFFRNHEIRFFISSIVFAVSIFGEDLIAFLPTLKKNPQIIIDFYHGDANARDARIKWYLMRKILEIRKEIGWFSKAETFRQNGFYVDMKENFSSPNNISAEEFEQARVRIEKVNKTTKYIIDTFTSNDAGMAKQIEDTKQNFDNEKYYLFIESAISRVRKGKKSFFDGLQKSFFEPLSDKNQRKEYKEFLTLSNRWSMNNKKING